MVRYGVVVYPSVVLYGLVLYGTVGPGRKVVAGSTDTSVTSHRLPPRREYTKTATLVKKNLFSQNLWV